MMLIFVLLWGVRGSLIHRAKVARRWIRKDNRRIAKEILRNQGWRNV